MSASIWQGTIKEHLPASYELVPAEEVSWLSEFVDVQCSDHIVLALGASLVLLEGIL